MSSSGSYILKSIWRCNLSVPVTGSVYNSSVNRAGNELSADFNQEVTFISGEPANYNMDLKLFGLIFLKTVHVNVVNEQQVYPCGFQAGLYLKSNGILVVKTDSIDSVYYGTKYDDTCIADIEILGY